MTFQVCCALLLDAGRWNMCAPREEPGKNEDFLGVRNCLCAHLSTLTRKIAVAEPPETFCSIVVVDVGRTRKLHKKEKEICMGECVSVGC